MPEERAASSDDPGEVAAARIATSRWVRRAPVMALALLVAAYLFRRHQVDLRFPVPWPDEGSFLWQALAFRDKFSLFAPEVNPQREALWMPPGFMVLEGLIFKIVPFSLSTSRALSALFVSGAVASVYACIERIETKLVYPIAAALFLFCPIGQMAGNVARMEGLELFVLALAYLLLERRRMAAVGVLLLAPLVHPNGIFGVAVGLPCYFARTRGVRGTARLADWLVVGGAALAWVLYGWHVSEHWAPFLRDMDAQIRFKQFVSGAEGGTLGRIGQPVVWGAAVALVGSVAYRLRSHASLGALPALAAALLLQTTAAAGWLYEVYPAFAVLVSSTVAADAVFARFAASRLDFSIRGIATALSALAIVGLDAAALRHNRFLERSLERATVRRKSLDPAYVTRGDTVAMERYLASITPPAGGRPVAVQFLPDAEALLYEKLRRPTFRYVQQTFYEHRYDVLVVHDSVWLPPFVHDLELMKLLFAKGGRYDTKVIHERDGTERWTAYRWAH